MTVVTSPSRYKTLTGHLVIGHGGFSQAKPQVRVSGTISEIPLTVEYYSHIKGITFDLCYNMWILKMSIVTDTKG